MTIKEGDPIPAVTLGWMHDGKVTELHTRELLAGKRTALFSVPGAFTPTCSAQHLPSYIDHADALKAKGIDQIACVSVNDVFVMDAWGKAQSAGDKVMMLSDGNAEFAKAIGLDMDGSAYRMGTRSKRFSMIIDDGKVSVLNIEAPGEYSVSSAEHMLEQL